MTPADEERALIVKYLTGRSFAANKAMNEAKTDAHRDAYRAVAHVTDEAARAISRGDHRAPATGKDSK